MINNRYEPELKQKVLRLYLEEGRTKKSLTEEYNLGQGTLTYCLQQYRKECDNSPIKREESDSYEVAKKLRKEIEELKKENDKIIFVGAFLHSEVCLLISYLLRLNFYNL